VIDQIYEILIARKVFQDGVWHVYNEAGDEIPDAAGVLWRAIPGALVMWPRPEEEVLPLPSARPPSRPQNPARPIQNVTYRAYVKINGGAYDAEIGKLAAKTAGVHIMSGTEFTANFGTLGVNAASKVALIPVDSLLKRGRLAAEGYKDISDEELVALIMEILDV
jgi:hypothetical protein